MAILPGGLTIRFLVDVEEIQIGPDLYDWVHSIERADTRAAVNDVKDLPPLAEWTWLHGGYY